MNIKKYISDNEYKITIYDNKIHILNYKSILDINSNIINIKLYNKCIKITGNNLLINKLDKYELLIIGNIKGLDIYDISKNT